MDSPVSSSRTERESTASAWQNGVPAVAAGHKLRVLSYNIQTGISSARYRHYVTHAWKHVLPCADRWENLDRIGAALSGFDIVGLQEIDSGSLRTGFINQTEYLAWKGGFPYWYHQTNRRMGKVTQHSNGLLSRLIPHEIVDHKLPGLRGRGALLARFGSGADSLALFIMHLALGKRTRLRQMSFLSELVNEYPHVILMGDLNCSARSLEMRRLLRHTKLQPVPERRNTFPSWRPRWHIDHILVTADIHVERNYIPHWLYSDHLPVAMDIVVPAQVRLYT